MSLNKIVSLEKNAKPTATEFIETLSMFKSKSDLEKNARFFREETRTTNKILGVRMRDLFALAKEFRSMEIKEIENLLRSDFYEARMGAVSIMDFQAREKKVTDEKKRELFDLYIKRHSNIDNWDMVDRSAPYVVGGYLVDKPRNVLFKLAKSKNVWERRTAIVSTYFFIRKNDLGDTFKLAEILVNDKHDLIQKAVGSWIREAGKRNKKMLTAFLDKHSATMPRTVLRYAIEKLTKNEKDFYMRKASAET
jgi:3-methyladenine DNA glycosylase AlkD